MVDVRRAAGSTAGAVTQAAQQAMAFIALPEEFGAWSEVWFGVSWPMSWHGASAMAGDAETPTAPRVSTARAPSNSRRDEKILTASG